MAEKYVRIVKICMMTVQLRGEVCNMSDRRVRNEGGTAPRVGFEPLFLCNDDGVIHRSYQCHC